MGVAQQHDLATAGSGSHLGEDPRLQAVYAELGKRLTELVKSGKMTEQQAGETFDQVSGSSELQAQLANGTIPLKQLLDHVSSPESLDSYAQETQERENTPGTPEYDGRVARDSLGKVDSNAAANVLARDSGDLFGVGAGDFTITPESEAAALATVNQANGIKPPKTDLEQKDDRFGNDLAWLDDMFQQNPNDIAKQAKELGTSANPELEKQQQSLVDEIRKRGTSADPATEAAQKRALDELFGLYEKGGLGAQDRAARAQARAESENWLKGQREASRQSMAQRGMLGSGADLLMQLGDSQGAATRLSAADLQTSADAERRALDALLAGGDLGTKMRDQSDAYTTENSRQAGGLLEGMRTASDDYTQKNMDRIGKIASENTNFLRGAYSDMIKQRNEWQNRQLDRQTDIALQRTGQDQGDQVAGYGQGERTAGTDVTSRNNAQSNHNSTTIGAYTGLQPSISNAGANVVGLTGAPQAHAGGAFTGGFNAAANVVSSLYGGGAKKEGEK